MTSSQNSNKLEVRNSFKNAAALIAAAQKGKKSTPVSIKAYAPHQLESHHTHQTSSSLYVPVDSIVE